MIKVGDRVKVHWPAWVDAGEHYHSPGRNHGRIGRVIEVTDYKVGSERLYEVKFDDSLITWPHWTNELKVIKELEAEVRGGR